MDVRELLFLSPAPAIPSRNIRSASQNHFSLGPMAPGPHHIAPSAVESTDAADVEFPMNEPASIEDCGWYWAGLSRYNKCLDTQIYMNTS